MLEPKAAVPAHVLKADGTALYKQAVATGDILMLNTLS